MKKYLNVLPIILLLFAILFSCRPDILLEQDARNQLAQSSLTSKIISLEESVHKNNLLPELNFAKKQFAKIGKQSASILGKTVNFGDSIFVDTDKVIYFQNGPNYHSYTFKIQRNVELPNAPLENLLFTPLPDGTYQGFWVVYNLTKSEKTRLEHGESFSLKGKTIVKPLDGISLSSITQKTVCTQQSYSYPTVCVGPGQHLPDDPLCPRVGSDRGQWVEVVYLDCSYVEELPEVIAPTTGGGGGGGGGDPAPEPCVAVASNPGEVGLVDGNGCAIGVPTQPNVGGNTNGDTECVKIKKITNETPNLKNKITNLNKTDTLNLDYEKGAVISDMGKGKFEILHKNGSPSLTYIEFATPETGEVIIFVHTHFDNPDMLPTFTFEDLAAFNSIYQWRKYNNKPLDKLSYYVITTSGVFVMRIEDGSLFDTEGYKLWTDQQADLLKDF